MKGERNIDDKDRNSSEGPHNNDGSYVINSKERGNEKIIYTSDKYDATTGTFICIYLFTEFIFLSPICACFFALITSCIISSIDVSKKFGVG